MIAAADASHPLGDSVIADHAMFVILAGSENTSALIGNTISAVVGADSDFEALCQNRLLAEAAVEEALRYDAPMQQLWRFATRDLTLHAANIGTGDRVVLFIGAANRDPDIFVDPDRFDPSRPDRRSLAFGAGPHVCLGTALATLEARICLQAIAAHRPSFDPDRPRKWRDRQTLRRLAHLPLRLNTEKR